jgi:hypothetical protein
MELKEINVPEGIVRHIDHEGQFADIKIDTGNNICSNYNFDKLYEEKPVDIKRTIGSVPVSMTSTSKKVLVGNWSSQKMSEEINMERMRYLLSTDEMLEEWHSCTLI